MAGIVGNALGYDQAPSPGDLSERLATMSLHDLLDQDINADHQDAGAGASGERGRGLTLEPEPRAGH